MVSDLLLTKKLQKRAKLEFTWVSLDTGPETKYLTLLPRICLDASLVAMSIFSSRLEETFSGLF